MSAEQAREVLDESARQARELVEWLLEEVGVPPADFDANPYCVLEPLETYVDRFAPDGSEEEKKEARLNLWTAITLCFGEILIQRYGGAWDITEAEDDPSDWEIVVKIDGRDGRRRHVSPLKMVRNYREIGSKNVYKPMAQLLADAGLAPWKNAPESPERPLTPVQRWIIGTSVLYAEVNGFPIDRLGASPAELEVERIVALAALFEYWGAFEPSQLHRQIDGLIDRGHRTSFAQTAAVAARPAAERAEYLNLLRQAKDMSAERALTQPFVDCLARLLTLRHGADAPAYEQWCVPLLTGDAEPDASPEATEVASFLGRLLYEPDYIDEEPTRLELSAQAPRDPARNPFLIWDYARAMLLYRWGYVVGWLPEEYCWEQMLPLARDIQRHYTSWQDMAAGYLLGRLLWSGGKAELHDAFEEAARRFAHEPDSPWNLVPWDLNLQQDW